MHDARKGMTYFSLVVLTTFGSISFTNWFLEGNITCPHCLKTMCLSHKFSTKDKG
jgi:hypothetical protein